MKKKTSRANKKKTSRVKNTPADNAKCIASTELQGLLKSLNHNLEQSKLSINNTLASSYKIIDNATNHFDEMVGSGAAFNQATRDETQPSGALGRQEMHDEMASARGAIEQSLGGVNQCLDSASDAYIAAGNTVNAQISDAPPHLVGQMEAVQQAINNMTAVLGQKHAAMQSLVQPTEADQSVPVESNSQNS